MTTREVNLNLEGIKAEIIYHQFEDTVVKTFLISFLFTGADMDNISIKAEEYEDIKICACVTAGVKSNAQRIGVDKGGSIEREGEFIPIINFCATSRSGGKCWISLSGCNFDCKVCIFTTKEGRVLLSGDELINLVLNACEFIW